MKAVSSVLYFLILSAGLYAQTPKLNSYSAAQATVFLDFDGQYVTGTSWNWSGPINAQPAAVSSTAIEEIFERVAEDFRIFNLNITTDSTVFLAAPMNKRIRIIITPTYEWYAPAGGVSFVGSFSWADDTPAWVFSGLLGNKVKNIAEAISHEAGHSLGLQHQSTYNGSCTKTAEYAGGQGTGEIGWAPIMGVGYYKNLTTWHNGTNAVGCNVYQNDIAIVAGSNNGFGLRSDEHADSHTSATALTLTSYDFNASGLVNSSSDKDVFQFTINTPTNVRLTVIPQNVGSDNSGANVDIRISLLNNQADTIGSYNPSELLNAGVDSNLNSGTYYLVIEGIGNANLADYSSVGYYSVSGTLGNVLPIHNLTITGKAANNLHELNWGYNADEAVKNVVVEYSKDGVHFAALTQLPADSKSFSWQPVDNNAVYYRIRVITVADERSYYSNIIALKETGNQPVKLITNIITNNIQLNTTSDFTYQLMDETGRLLQRGQLRAGANRIETATVRNGLLILRVQGMQESWTFKLIKR